MFDFPYLIAGFTEDEWFDVPRTDKVIIKDWYIFHGNMDFVMRENFYETDGKIRKARDRYGLRNKVELPHLACVKI